MDKCHLPAGARSSEAVRDDLRAGVYVYVRNSYIANQWLTKDVGELTNCTGHPIISGASILRRLWGMLS
jgi:hypothetical protein